MLVVFIIECVVKIAAEELAPWRYWLGPEWKWNNFDFVIVVFCLPGVPVSDYFPVAAALARLARIAKIIRKVPQLQMSVMGLLGGLSSIGYIVVLLFLIFYLFAIAGIMFFRENDPWHFGNVGLALLTLFRMSTLEDWTDVMCV